MEKTYIVANWKSNKTESDALTWLTDFGETTFPENKVIAVCPSFSVLSAVSRKVEEKQLPLMVGAQNISPFEEGAYTGEQNGGQLKEFVTLVIIGHSERRNHFHETDDEIAQKVNQALAHNLIPLLCIQDRNTPVPQGVEMVAYEPISAIGTGHPDTPEDAEAVAKAIKEQNPHVSVILYGGSVTADDVNSFTRCESISGVLVGKASLDPQSFQKIIENA